MKLLAMVLIFNQVEYKILLKRTPNLLYPFIPKGRKEMIMGRGDTLRIEDYWWAPDDTAYVTEIEPTGYAILSFDWNIDDTVFWYYYYPENDTTTGEPTGEYPMGVYSWVTYAYELPESCISYWKYWGISIWDTIPVEGIHFQDTFNCGGALDDLTPGFAWSILPAYLWYGKLVFNHMSFFPGKWYVELYKRMAGGNKVFLKRDSFELKDTFTLGRFIFPSDTDTVYGVENILILLHENHWANVKLHITSIPVERGEIDTTLEFHVYRMEEEKVKSIPFDFGNTYGQIYKLTLHIEDYWGNTDDDTAFAIVGKPVITVTLNPETVWPLYTQRIPRDSSRTEVIVKVTTPSGRPVSDYSVILTAVREQYSGGHDHPNKPDGGPVGKFDESEGETDENGEFRTYYTASEFGGVEVIIATGEDPGVIDDAELRVKVPGLTLLPEASNYYKKVGGTPYHHGPPNWEEDHNHYGTSDLIDAIYAIALNYVDRGGEIIWINDMSLPWGGLFDINGDWEPPHDSHRIGENVDLAGRCVRKPPNKPEERGRMCKEKIFYNVIRYVARGLNLYIRGGYEYKNGIPQHHYHYTIKRR